MSATMRIPASAADSPAPAGSALAAGGGEQAAAVTTAPVTEGSQEAGASAASYLISALADAGMSPDRIGTVIEDVLACRHDQPTAVSEEFYDAFADTAATYIADLRDLEAG